LFTSQGCCLAHLGNIDQTDGSLEEVDGYCSVVEVRASGVFIGVLAGTDRHMLDRFAAGGFVDPIDWTANIGGDTDQHVCIARCYWLVLE
jgi:hypothetical protein